jgi:hypothetical protein
MDKARKGSCYFSIFNENTRVKGVLGHKPSGVSDRFPGLADKKSRRLWYISCTMHTADSMRKDRYFIERTRGRNFIFYSSSFSGPATQC